VILRPLTAAALLALCALSPAGAAEGIEPLERVAAVARAAAAAATLRPLAELEVGAFDPRLRLPACATAPVGRPSAATRSAAQLTIEVRCAAPQWRHFVVVRVHAEEAVVVAAHPLSRLQVITADDVVLVPRDLSLLPGGYFRRVEEAIGRIAQRGIGPGEVLAGGVLRAATLVHRGQAVTLVVQAGGLNVRAPGIALADGGLDERVRVRNTNSAREIEGVVRSPETVEVALE
jgi:flagella basal body P-ring formation protein FlgA